jgi:hypothetical protein
MTASATPDRVHVLERRWLRIVFKHGRAVDAEPRLDGDGEAVEVPIPAGIEDDVWDAVEDPPEVWTSAVDGWRSRPHARPTSIAGRARLGLPCEVCAETNWYLHGKVTYCRTCKRGLNARQMRAKREAQK